MSTTAYDRLIDALTHDGRRVDPAGTDQAMAQCPAHDDRNPSLSIRRTEDHALIYCHAGCDTADVLAAVDLTARDLYDNPRGTAYHYTDPLGGILRTVHRLPSTDKATGAPVLKRFTQSGQTKGPAPLLRLPAVLDAVKAGRVVHLVEGEKDVQALEAIGVTATTAPAGASNFHLADVEPLRGARVVAVVDRDDGGHKWAATVARRLAGLVESLTMVTAAAGKDASDHVAAGHTLADLIPYTPPERAPDGQETPQEDDPGPTLASRMVHGGAFILDTPAEVPAVWGNGAEVLWSQGESCILAGPPGVGKTTLTGQIVRGLLGLDRQVLGYQVDPAAGRVLYLAMDRPRQIARALARHFTPDERALLDEQLRVWPGPPPADVAKNPGLIAAMATEAGASHVILDSLKDAALGLSEDEVGAAYNRARQTAIAAGVELLELHHVVKRGHGGTKPPTTLADLYGSTWITAGAGSVVLLWGAAGDPIVELTHLKQPSEPVGPLRVIHDHAAGHSQVWHSTDPLTVVNLAGSAGVTAQRLAMAIFETDKPDRNEIEKARRRLEKLVRADLAEAVEGPAPESGGKAQTVYRAITQAITPVIDREAITHDVSNHDSGKGAGQTITEPITAITQGSNHVSTPPYKGVERVPVAEPCPVCAEPLSGRGYTARCRPDHHVEATP